MSKCEYCNNTEDKMTCVAKCFGILKENQNQEINLIIYSKYMIMGDSEERYSESTTKINYCPICGRKLEV